MPSLDPLDDLVKASNTAPAKPSPPPAVPPIVVDAAGPDVVKMPEPVAVPAAPEPMIETIRKVLEPQDFDFMALRGKLQRKGLDAAAELDTKKLLKGVIPTGHKGFDDASGIGGIGCGIITEMFGPESVGKSTIALMAVARAQRLGLPALWIDQEHSFDPAYAATFGVILDNPKLLYVPQPTSIEDSFEIARMMLDNGFRGIIVYDSLGSGLPREVVNDNAMGDMRIGLKSSVMGVCLQQLEPRVHSNKAAMVFINQLRSNIKIQARGEQRLANADVGEEASITTPGGWIMKHIASVRIQLRKLHARLWEEREKRSEIEVKFVKNKMSAAYESTVMVLRYGSGFDPYDKALADKLLKRV